MKVKIFENQSVPALQFDVNKWLDENPGIEIKLMTQSEHGDKGQLVLTIVYIGS